MNSTFLLNMVRFIIFLALQVTLFSKIDLFGYINPFPYILFIILYPVNANKYGLLFSSFALGLLLDCFFNSGGVHAAACVTIAYIRPLIFKFAFGLSYEYQTVRLNDSLTPERFSFLILIVILHQLVLFVLEFFNFEYLWSILLRTIVSSLFTLLLCVLIIYLIKPSKR